MDIFDNRTSLLLGVLACFLDFRVFRRPFNSTLSLLSIRTILSGSEKNQEEVGTKFNLCLSLVTPESFSICHSFVKSAHYSNLRFWAQNWTLAKPENSIFGLPEAWFLLPVPPPPTPRFSFSSETVLECLTLRFAVIGAWRWCWLPFAPPLSGFRCRRLLAVRQIPKPSVRRVSNSLIFL